MRRILGVGLAGGVAGCVRLNPGFGDGGGTGTGGTGDTSRTGGESTAVDPADPVTTTEPNGTGRMSGVRLRLRCGLDRSDPALPDGVPMPATWEGEEWSVINHGLQFDQSCDRYGSWGVVPKGSESFIE